MSGRVRYLGSAGDVSRIVPLRAGVLALSFFALPFSSAYAGEDQSALPKIYTNQQYVADVTKPTTLDLEDIKSVLKYILDQLPDRVKVFPTENYYYFYFYQGGVKYAGNLRFDVEERDKGFVEFIYFKDSTEMSSDDRDYHATFGKDDGVVVEKVQDLVYRVTYEGRSVTFELNDLSQVKPTADALGEDEIFLGPVADELGVRFYLTFDEKLKIFHYVMDESAPVSDEWVDVPDMPHLQIGRRTSFALLRDPTRNRRLLVGVFDPNVTVNNYLDGPFDQLPDNFLKGDALRRALALERPNLDKSVDRLGIAADVRFRERIAPYIEYIDLKELAPAEECTAKEDRAEMYLCLNGLAPDD